MKIAFLIFEFPPHLRGGLGRYAQNISFYFKDHDLSIFTLNPGGLPRQEVREKLSIFRPIPWWLDKIMKRVRFDNFNLLGTLLVGLNLLINNILCFFVLAKLHKKTKFDVIAVHDFTNSVSGILCGLFLKVPLVFHVHGVEFSMTERASKKDPFRIVARLERLTARLAQKIIVPSEEMKQILVQCGWEAAKIEVIVHGYENREFLKLLEPLKTGNEATMRINELRNKLGIRANEKVLLFIGRLVNTKGIFYLLKALPEVIKNYPGVKLVVLGRGENEKVRSLIEELNLGQNTAVYYKFLESEDVLLHYLMADICVFPSKYEPFGLVATEAMSLGKPVILGHGFPRVLSAGEGESPSALVVQSDQYSRIKDQILYLLTNPDAANRLGTCAQTYVKSRFSWDNAVSDTIRVYGEAIRAG